MDSRELGLITAFKLTDFDEFHYGFWDENQKPSIKEFIDAQKRYSDMIISSIQDTIGENDEVRILDVGCGTGTIMARLLTQGYKVDCVIPSNEFRQKVIEKIERLDINYKVEIYDCLFENFPESEQSHQYSLIYFCESFHYIPMKACFSVLKALLKENGKIMVCDFFKSMHHSDGGAGDKSLGGGHPIDQFYQLMEQSNFEIIKDVDITKNMSPNFDMLDDIFMNRLYPAMQVIDEYLKTKYKILYGISKILFSRKIKKIKYKYFSGHRNRRTFEKYKIYRLVTFKKK